MLPKKTRGSVQVTQMEPEEDIDCPICRDPVGVRTESDTLETWRHLPCGHKFGRKCIMEYFGALMHEKPLCPICREPSYHSCGHPVLPQPLPVIQNSRYIHPQHRLCEYCKANPLRMYRECGSERRPKGWRRLLRNMLPWTKRRQVPRAYVQEFGWDLRTAEEVRDAWEGWWASQHPDPGNTPIQECPGRIRRTKNKLQRSGTGLLGLGSS